MCVYTKRDIKKIIRSLLWQVIADIGRHTRQQGQPPARLRIVLIPAESHI